MPTYFEINNKQIFVEKASQCGFVLQLQLSAVLAQVRSYYNVLTEGGGGGGTIKRADFEKHLKSFKVGREERKKWFTILDVSQDG